MLGEVLTAMVTPFKEDGSVDYDRYRELATFLVDNGSDGVVTFGTTGESPTLSDEEKLEALATALDAVGDRATVVAGTGTYSTAHSVHLTEQAHELGAHAMLVVTPYYNKPPPRGIVEHFRAIAAATDRPVIAYNIPSRVVINIEPSTFAELREIPNVTAVKQAHDDLDEARAIVDLGFDLYTGDDPTLLPFLRLGATGVVSVLAHVVGPQLKAICRAYQDGDEDEARRIDDELAPAYELLRVAINPIPIKAALNMLGHEVGGHRLPMVPADGRGARARARLPRARRPARSCCGLGGGFADCAQRRGAEHCRLLAVERLERLDHLRAELRAGVRPQLLHRRRDAARRSGRGGRSSARRRRRRRGRSAPAAGSRRPSVPSG